MLFVNKENPHVFNFEEKMFTKEIKDGREAPWKPSYLKICIKYNLVITEGGCGENVAGINQGKISFKIDVNKLNICQFRKKG